MTILKWPGEQLHVILLENKFYNLLSFFVILILLILLFFFPRNREKSYDLIQSGQILQQKADNLSIVTTSLTKKV